MIVVTTEDVAGHRIVETKGQVFGLGVTLEARRYRGRAGPGRWQPTSERFVDPSTGRLTEVQYDPSTGERRYVDVGPGPSEPGTGP